MFFATFDRRVEAVMGPASFGRQTRQLVAEMVGSGVACWPTHALCDVCSEY